MKPTKNRIYCYGCKKPKMLFPSKEKADNFMNFNKEYILEETGKAPVRSYFCEVCGGYHVTSNPSSEEGERMDYAIHNKIRQIQKANVNAEEARRIKHLISGRVEKAKSFLNFGLVEEAEDLLDICEFDMDDLRKLDPSGVRLIRVTGKIYKLQTKIAKIKEYLSLEDCQIESLLEDKSFRNQKSEWQNLFNILEVKKLLRMIQSVDEYIDKGDCQVAKNILSQCKGVIAGFSGMGKTFIQDFFKTKIEERERMCPTSTKAYAKSVIQSKSCPSKSHSDNPHYKTEILSIIERIELATTAYQHNDMSSCYTHIEIADFMLDELGLIDENVEVLVRQLDKLKQLIY